MIPEYTIYKHCCYFNFCRIYCWHKISMETPQSSISALRGPWLHTQISQLKLKKVLFFFFCIEDNSVIQTKRHTKFQYKHQKRTFQSQCTVDSAIILHVLHAAAMKSSCSITAKNKWQLRWCAQTFGCRVHLALVTVTHFVCARGETLISAHKIHLWPFFSHSIETNCEN